MRNRSRLVFGIVLVMILVGFAWLVLRPREREPEYQGKPISAWLNDRDPKTGRLSAAATNALDQLGTNAIPWLLDEAAKHGFPFRDLANGLLKQQSVIHLRFAQSPDHQAIAQRGFRALGTMGIQAVADGLTNSDQWIRHGCVGQWELCNDYPDILTQPLIDALHDPAPAVRGRAANAIGMLHPKPEQVVPILIAMLSDSNDHVRSMAALGLSLYNTQAKSAFPILVSKLTNSSSQFQFFATNALKAIDPAAAAKIGIK